MKRRKRLTVRDAAENGSKQMLFDFEQAYDYFLSAKKSEGLREKTLIRGWNSHGGTGFIAICYMYNYAYSCTILVFYSSFATPSF